jgi:flagellar biogenesis protein FliO
MERVTDRGQSGVLDATGDEAAGTAAPRTPAEAVSASRAFGPEPFPTAGRDDVGGKPEGKASQMRPLVTVTSSLAIVLGLFGGLVWLVRRSGGKAGTQLPEEVFSLLGRTTLGPRQTISLARCGRRILVLAVSPGTTTTLAEITDPDEVADLIAQCGNGGSRQLFQRTLQEMGERGPVAPGFVDADPERPRQSLFVNG